MSDTQATIRLFDYYEWANHRYRGQVAVFLRQLGVTPPASDLVAFDCERR